MALNPEYNDLKGEINIKDETGKTPIFYSTIAGNYDICLLLLKNDASLE
jgi:ankyrin repeat protein